MKELGTIRDYFAAGQSFIPKFFVGPDGNFWSGTSMTTVEAYALHKGGSLGSFGDTKVSSFYVRCVRSGPP